MSIARVWPTRTFGRSAVSIAFAGRWRGAPDPGFRKGSGT